jgi:hypothetical protein
MLLGVHGAWPAVLTLGALFAFTSGSVVTPSRARANDRLTEAETLAEAADFEGAEAALERAVIDGSLSREDLLRWLEVRALIEYGRDRGELEPALRALLSVEPDHP